MAGWKVYVMAEQKVETKAVQLENWTVAHLAASTDVK
jgi:hypothetical protein